MHTEEEYEQMDQLLQEAVSWVYMKRTSTDLLPLKLTSRPSDRPSARPVVSRSSAFTTLEDRDEDANF